MMSEIKMLEQILDKTHEAVITINQDRIIVKCNKKLLNLLGPQFENPIGKPIESVLPGLDCDKEISNYEYKAQRKSYIVRNEKITLQTDNYQTLFLSDNHFNIELGNRYAEVKVLKDIYESILNSIDEGIHVADINGRVSYINPSQQHLDGLTADVIGRHWTEVYDLDNETSLVLKALNEGLHTHDAYQNYVTTEGKYVSIVCSAMPLYSEGKIIGAAAITKDFIKFKEMAERVLRLQKQFSSGKKPRGGKNNTYYTFDQILGNNKHILESIRWSKVSAGSDSSVLIYGETGTGKEMIAQSIHSASSRAEEPFLAINCAAIPENLLEGILFGTTKGAFTGAVDRAGLIELAHKGTLFLDEINSMPVQLQTKLLRMVEEKKVMRVGGRNSITVDVRTLASCNVEPSQAIERGQLRSDLFYRLAVIYIFLPPLRDRLDDLDILSSYFIAKYNRQTGRQVAGLCNEVKKMFALYNWPGNVRELMHCIECAVNMATVSNELISTEHLPKYLLIRMSNSNDNCAIIKSENGVDSDPAPPPNKPIETGKRGLKNIIEQIQAQEKEEIVSALKLSKGNIAKAAASLGLSRQRLHYRLKKYNLR
jgi:arginine utilization regulatory protein